MPGAGTVSSKQGVLCAGLFSSGSTWAFNAVVQLAEFSAGSGHVVSIYADDMTDGQESAAAAADVLIVKSHRPSPTLRVLSRLAGMPTLLTVREPRDAVASLMKRFDMAFEQALEVVADSAESMVALRGRDHLLLLRYEDGFTRQPETLTAIAGFLRLTVMARERAAVFDALTPDAVLATIARFRAQGVFGDLPARVACEPKTQWHPNHIGDQQIGTWRRSLTDADAARVLYATRAYCAAFGYTENPALLAIGADIRFSSEGVGAGYLGEGFSAVEPWGIWTDMEAATLRLPMRHPINDPIQLQLTCRLGPTLRRDLPGKRARLLVNDRPVLEFSASARHPDTMLLAVRIDRELSAGSREIALRFEVDGMLPASDLGHGDDRRKVGIGLIRIQVDHVAGDSSAPNAE